MYYHNTLLNLALLTVNQMMVYSFVEVAMYPVQFAAEMFVAMLLQFAVVVTLEYSAIGKHVPNDVSAVVC